MAFSYTVTNRGVMGDQSYVQGTWVATGVTSGDIVTGLKSVNTSLITFKTAQRGAIDDTSTAGTISLSSVTSGDAGEFLAFGVE